uniref:Uncharacterized protein n=1 Tax=Acrobeloides nanus TaxID=290746 RepID=A0A914BWH0_9BILA
MPPGSLPTMVVVKNETNESDNQESPCVDIEFSDLAGGSSNKDDDLDTLVFNNGKRKKWLKDWTVVKQFDTEDKYLEWSRTFLKGYVRGTTARLLNRRCTYYRCQFNKRVGYKPCVCEVRVEFRTDTSLIKVETYGDFPFAEHNHDPETIGESKPETSNSRRSKFKPEIKSMMNLGIQMMMKPIDISKIIEEAGYNSPNIQQISLYKKRNKRKLAKTYDPIMDATYLLNMAQQNESADNTP